MFLKFLLLVACLTLIQDATANPDKATTEHNAGSEGGAGAVGAAENESHVPHPESNGGEGPSDACTEAGSPTPTGGPSCGRRQDRPLVRRNAQRNLTVAMK